MKQGIITEVGERCGFDELVASKHMLACILGCQWPVEYYWRLGHPALPETGFQDHHLKCGPRDFQAV